MPKNRAGFTLLELIISMAIVAIIGVMAFSLYFFGVKTLAKGEEQSEVQFDTRMAADLITGKVRFAHSVEILSSTSSIPGTVTNSDCYLYKDTSIGKDKLLYKDDAGTKVLATFDELTLSFSTTDSNKTLYFNIQGRYAGQNFSIDSKVLPLNLPADETISGISGVAIKFDKLAEAETGAISIGPVPPNAYTGASYIPHTFIGSGGTPSYTFSIDAFSGSLPTGLLLEPSGLLHGTPTTPGKYQFKVDMLDNSTPKKSASRTFEVIIGDSTLTAAIVASRITSGVYPFIQPAMGETLIKIPEVPADYMVVVNSSNNTGVIDLDGNIIMPAANTTVELTFTVISLINSIDTANTGIINVNVITTTNSTPTAQNVKINGIVKVGSTITGSYNYVDSDGDPEGGSIYKWYRGNSANGAGKVEIAQGTVNESTLANTAYTLTLADQGKYIFFGVTPVATAGIIQGAEAVSLPTDLVLPEKNKPIAKDVRIAGTNGGATVSSVVKGTTLYGEYIYFDIDGDTEFNSIYRWYYVKNGSLDLIDGETNNFYVTKNSDGNKTICFEVIPRSSADPKEGNAVTSFNVDITN